MRAALAVFSDGHPEIVAVKESGASFQAQLNRAEPQA
jgi:hypothetical protein